jgi:hypothetical protein
LSIKKKKKEKKKKRKKKKEETTNKKNNCHKRRQTATRKNSAVPECLYEQRQGVDGDSSTLREAASSPA